MATKIKYRKMALPDYLETIDCGMTTAELSKVIGIPARTLYRQAKAGRIPSFRVGSSVRFDPHVVAKWLRAR
jgi:excisionase family DNA binding protein